MVGNGKQRVASRVKIRCFVDPSVHLNLPHMRTLSPDFLFTPVIITAASRGICHLNVNRCRSGALAETTDCHYSWVGMFPELLWVNKHLTRITERNEVPGTFRDLSESEMNTNTHTHTHTHTHMVDKYLASWLQLTSVDVAYWLFGMNKHFLQKQPGGQIHINNSKTAKNSLTSIWKVCGNIWRKSTSACLMMQTQTSALCKNANWQQHTNKTDHTRPILPTPRLRFCVYAWNKTWRVDNLGGRQQNNPKLFMRRWHFACDSQRLTFTSSCADWTAFCTLTVLPWVF